MHLFFFARGINSQVEVFKILAQGQFFKWKRKSLTDGEDKFILVQGSLRPSVLGAWEYVFPEECLAEVLAIMGVKKESIGVTPTFMNNLKLGVIRKIMGVDKISDEIFEEASKIPASILINTSWRALSHLVVPGVSIHPIGIKKDIYTDCPQFPDAVSPKGYYQEML